MSKPFEKFLIFCNNLFNKNKEVARNLKWLLNTAVVVQLSLWQRIFNILKNSALLMLSIIIKHMLSCYLIVTFIIRTFLMFIGVGLLTRFFQLIIIFFNWINLTGRWAGRADESIVLNDVENENVVWSRRSSMRPPSKTCK